MSTLTDNCKHDFAQNWGYIYCHKCTMTIFSDDEKYKSLKEALSTPVASESLEYNSLQGRAERSECGKLLDDKNSI